jgi:hypothetical protein
MLLKKQTEDGVISAIYSSSNILASKYDTANGNLIITFKVGSQYRYDAVSVADYTRFEIDESQGVIFNTHIKKYPFEKLSPIDVKLLTEEILAIKDAKAKSLINEKKQNIAVTLQSAIAFCGPVPSGLTQDDVDTMLKDSLEKLQSQISDYLTIK